CYQMKGYRGGVLQFYKHNKKEGKKGGYSTVHHIQTRPQKLKILSSFSPLLLPGEIAGCQHAPRANMGLHMSPSLLEQLMHPKLKQGKIYCSTCSALLKPKNVSL
uniref:Uncharacterized protein n=1 Tax=Apteryx owenii TaxID=8824 RepID=A0A8B9Q6B8_APTOW